MTPSWLIASKDFRLLRRDARSAVILLLMPLVLIAVLGLTLGDAFGRKADDQLQVSVVVEDAGLPPEAMRKPPPRDPATLALLGGTATTVPLHRGYPEGGRWSDAVLSDLKDTGDIRIEIVPNRAEAEKLVQRGRRAAVIVFRPEFSDRVERCSFVGPDFKKDPVNPMDRYGLVPESVGVEILENKFQPVGSAVAKQVTQVSLMRVIIPWMIGQAFDLIGTPAFMDRLDKYIPGFSVIPASMRISIGHGIRKGIGAFFGSFEFTALTWHGLTKDNAPAVRTGNDAGFRTDSPTFGRGQRRYQILVPNYTVTFAFFLVLTVGWLFVAERRSGTMVRLRAAPISRGDILLGKMLPCLGVSLVQGFGLLLCGKWVFGMTWGSEPWLLVPVVMGTSFAAVGLAMLVAGLARTETQVAVYGTLLVLVLAGLSGSLLPREMMPEAMRTVSLVTPHAWALDAYEQLLHPDKPAVDVGTVWTSVGALMAFGLGFNLLAWWRMRLD